LQIIVLLKMLDSLNIRQKKALARVGLGILGISYGGKIRTNEPDIYALFVDFFYVDSQEEILPILQDIISIDQEEATEIAKQLSNREKDEFRTYMIDAAGNDGRRLLAIAAFMQNIGFNSSYFD
jgi:hypothetical protein